ncbi:HU family DNA-binding protein [Anabaena azotica]|uniref:HU family DNA-binding protein n=1 Tax=Anabaena azotica FACHB-119 TaxID=947527 RepID=A0ABR8CY48_9NOST|nr:HU family DNA-binding protein [Anabaena azotica]MBD2499855.1 HU family DNA-binding protein [Anabaena azotica FACHB-119]
MNTQLSEYIQNATGYSKANIDGVLESFINFVQLSLRKGESVRIEKFGVFSHKDLPERDGRNPKTGEVIRIAARRKAVFKFANTFSIEPEPSTLQSQNQSEAGNTKSPPPIPPELLASSSENLWHMQIDGKPVQLKESELLSKGLTETTPLWSDRTNWKLAKDIPELSYLFSKAA